MQIQAANQGTQIAKLGNVRAAVAPKQAAGRPTPATIANRMVQAPEALPLLAIPTEWVPMGQSQRRVDTRTGPIVLERGNVRVQRDASSISVQQIDNRDLAGITLRVDPRDPRAMVAQTAVETMERIADRLNEFLETEEFHHLQEAIADCATLMTLRDQIAGDQSESLL